MARHVSRTLRRRLCLRRTPSPPAGRAALGSHLPSMALLLPYPFSQHLPPRTRSHNITQTRTQHPPPTHHAPQEISKLAAEHSYEFLPANTVYRQAEALGVTSKQIDEINAAQEAYEAAVMKE